MFSSLIKTLFALLAILALSQAFAPAILMTPTKTMTTTSLNLFGGKKKKPEGGESGGGGFLEGKGARITIREDEDNAMWIDEPGDMDKKKKGGKKGK